MKKRTSSHTECKEDYMEVIYIVLVSALISGLFCFAFFFGFALGLKQVKTTKEDRTVEIDETNVDAYKRFAEWMNYTGPQGGIK